MGQKLQVVFDCRDPEGMSKFYAGALLYRQQEPPSGFSSWDEALKAIGVPDEELNSASAITDPEGRGPRIYFQRMDTPKFGKNRLHIDINASEGSKVPIQVRKGQVRAAVERLVGLGATEQQEWEEDGEYWVVMVDPEGNEFCVQ